GPSADEPPGPAPSAVLDAPPAGGDATGGGGRRRLRGRRPPITLVVPGLLVAVAALAPAAYLILRAGFSFSLLRDELASPTTVPLLWNTIELLLLVCLCTAVLGV